MVQTSRIPTPPNIQNGEARLPVDSAAHHLMRQYAELTGVPLFCVEAPSGRILARSEDQTLELITLEIRRMLGQREFQFQQVIERPGGLLVFSLPLPDVEGTPVFAAGYALANRQSAQMQVVLAAAEQNWSQKAVNAWWDTQTFFGPQYLKNLLTTVLQHVELLEE